jgi:hypothetical protein
VHDLRGALVLPASGSQYGSFADAVQAKLTEELAGSAPPGPAAGAPQYGLPTTQPPAPAQGGGSPGATPPASGSSTGSAAGRAAAPAVTGAGAGVGGVAGRRSRGPQPLVNRVEDLGSEVLAPAVVVPPQLATFPTPPAPSSDQRLPRPFVPLAALAALLVAAGVVSGLWRSVGPGRGRRNGRRRVERLQLGD